MKHVLTGLCLPIIMAGCSSATDASQVAPQPVTGQLAFPGAIGYGAAAKGGRGGRVIAVDTLADSGAGSLRACIDAQGPRTCVFRISGVIRFTSRPPVIRNPYLTIAGQTAPGGGIIVSHSGGDVGFTPMLVKNTHDIVIRHIRVRNDRLGTHRGAEDGFTIENSERVILDHVSASWARDELVNGYGDNDWITISNSIFAEGIPKHDKCALLASDPKGPQHLSFIGNICAHNGDRNPEINFPPRSCVEVVNNILYNGQSAFAEIWEKFGGTPVSMIGNSFIAGRNTRPHTVGIARNVMGSTGPSRIYLADNQFDGDFTHATPVLDEAKVADAPCPGTITATEARQAYRDVLRGAGAFPRDPFDRRVVKQVKERKGQIVKQPGMIDELAMGEPYPDADRDGMDDGWEAQAGTDRRRSDPWDDADGDGVANLDQFLAEREQQVMARGGDR